MLTQLPTNPLLNKSKVRLGRPLGLSDGELRELSKITETDIKYVAGYWRSIVPAKFALLLNAVGFIRGPRGRV